MKTLRYIFGALALFVFASCAGDITITRSLGEQVDIFPDYKVSESSEAKKPAKKKAEPAQPVDYSLILD